MLFCLFLIIRRPPRSTRTDTLFPYTTLFRSLNLRADRGEINPDDFDVPVMVLKGDDATLSETSLAANFHQLKMTPAEECRAFQHFLGTSGDIDAVAKRFGLTRRRSEERRVGKEWVRTWRSGWSPYT